METSLIFNYNLQPPMTSTDVPDDLSYRPITMVVWPASTPFSSSNIGSTSFSPSLGNVNDIY